MTYGVCVPATIQYTWVARAALTLKFPTPAYVPLVLMVLPARTTVVFQFGTGREFVVTFVIAVPARLDSHESPVILMPRICSALPEKSRLFSTAHGYCRAPMPVLVTVP